MSFFLIWRAVFLVLLVLLNGTICATASLNLVEITTSGATRSLDIYLILLSATSLVFLFPIILVETLRRGAVTSTVWFECSWLCVLWLANLCAAAISISLAPSIGPDSQILASFQILVAVTWISTLLLLAQFLLMTITSLSYQARHSEVWKSSVKEFQWFRGGGNAKSTILGSGPPTPTWPTRNLNSNPVPYLERMANEWQPTRPSAPAPSRQMNFAGSEPQPLTLANAPELPLSRAPTHFKATVDSERLGRTPSGKRKPAPPTTRPQPSALYPQTVQTALNGAILLGQTPPTLPEPPRMEPIVLNTGRHDIILTVEPPPIKDWPRPNPQEPVRSKKSMMAPTAAAHQASASGAHVRSVTEPATETPSTQTRTFGPRAPRRRPAPLDLTAALPGASRRR